EYPKRGKLFCLDYMRLIRQAAVGQIFGPAAVGLLDSVVLMEDKLFYKRPPNFFNDQIGAAIGINGWDTLARLRTKLVDRGWLVYQPGGKSTPGVYWVSVPPDCRGVSDWMGGWNFNSESPSACTSNMEEEAEGEDSTSTTEGKTLIEQRRKRGSCGGAS